MNTFTIERLSNYYIFISDFGISLYDV